MLRYLQLEERIVGVLELLELVGELALVALPYLPIALEHLWLLWLLVLLGVLLTLFLLLLLGHLDVHFPAHFLCVCGLELGPLLLGQVGILPHLFLLLGLLLALLDLPELDLHVEVLLEGGQVLQGLDPLGGRDVLSVVYFEGGHVGDYVLLAPFPVLAGVARQVQLLDAG